MRKTREQRQIINIYIRKAPLLSSLFSHTLFLFLCPIFLFSFSLFSFFLFFFSIGCVAIVENNTDMYGKLYVTLRMQEKKRQSQGSGRLGERRDYLVVVDQDKNPS